MQLPLINLNGTSSDMLVEQYSEVADYVRTALTKLRGLDINGRDYYPISDEAITIARREHTQRILAFESVLKDLEVITEHCAGI